MDDTPIMADVEFNQHLKGVGELFFSFALRLTADRDRAKDLMQDTLMRAYYARNKFKSATNFKAWVTTIMRNSFISEYRKKLTPTQVERALGNERAAEINMSVSNPTYSTIMINELRLIMNELADTHRIPFEMFCNGSEYLEIAEVLDLPLGTVKSRVFFARKKLQRLIYLNYIEYIRYA